VQFLDKRKGSFGAAGLACWRRTIPARLAMVERKLKVIRQRDRLIAPDQRGECDDAAIAPRKAGTLPHVTEQAILRVFVESRRNHLNILPEGALVQ
jgi:hypothetical protein